MQDDWKANKENQVKSAVTQGRRIRRLWEEKINNCLEKILNINRNKEGMIAVDC